MRWEAWAASALGAWGFLFCCSEGEVCAEIGHGNAATSSQEYCADSFAFARWDPTQGPCPLDPHTAAKVARRRLEYSTPDHSAYIVNSIQLNGTLRGFWHYNIDFCRADHGHAVEPNGFQVRVALDGSIIDSAAKRHRLRGFDHTNVSESCFVTLDHYQVVTTNASNATPAWDPEMVACPLELTKVTLLAQKEMERFLGTNRVDTVVVGYDFSRLSTETKTISGCIISFLLIHGGERGSIQDARRGLDEDAWKVFPVMVRMNGEIPEIRSTSRKQERSPRSDLEDRK